MSQLHVLNGSVSLNLWRSAGLPGEAVVFAELFHEGPVRPGLPRGAFLAERADTFVRNGWGSRQGFLAQARQARTKLETALATPGAEVIFWYEHDLYDQLLLLYHLDVLAHWRGRAAACSLICIGEHPDVRPFHGLGQLSTEAFRALDSDRAPVTTAMVDTGSRVWRAFGETDPKNWEVHAHREHEGLPFLATALHRLAEEFPDTQMGLGRTERQALADLAQGEKTPACLFRAHLDAEEAPFLGDMTFYTRLVELHRDPALVERVDGHPFVLPSGGEEAWTPFTAAPVRLTPLGRDVLDGRVDSVARRGIDRWIGGTHLSGFQSPWRWDIAQDHLRAMATTV